MKIPVYYSIDSIRKQYGTGEEPVLTQCSDRCQYVCKYMRSSATPYKLICELIGAIFASKWGLHTPDIAFIKILPEHWTPFRTINYSAPSFGSKIKQDAVDVNATWNNDMEISSALQEQIANIALFDLWVANEDRNWNNANLLYDLTTKDLIAIDHGCILNTATFDFNLSLLTQNETILYSDLAHSILKDLSEEKSNAISAKLNEKFQEIINRKVEFIKMAIENIPKEWNADIKAVENKLNQLFDKKMDG